MPESTTVNSAGKRMVQIRTTGAEKQHCTVMLGITASGQKLPPYVVNKHKTVAKEKFPQGIIVRVQESGWMTEDLVDNWIKSVWFRRPGALLCQRSVLVLDSFQGHTTENVKAQLR
jgi:3D (Asp-Asp-Asp) domain-containing protein